MKENGEVSLTDKEARLMGVNDAERKQKNLNRIFFTSRKTLQNEFNHFEGNMNIFQPAIDISDTALKKEKDRILEFLTKL